MTIYYIYSALDWFTAEAQDENTLLAACALIGDDLGIITEDQTLIKHPFSGNMWYNETLKISKAKLLDSIPNPNIKNCLLSFSPIREESSVLSKLIVSKAKELAKEL